MTLTDDLIPIKEFSERTGIPLATLYDYRHTNRGPVSYVISGRVFYPRDALRQWIYAQMAASRRGGA
jgi:predicted DNA-binding transcriptional regulator AlpA